MCFSIFSFFFFFFSSRRRHTRYIGDWSSDVCSSDLYDDLMSGAFFRDLSLPKPNAYLGVGSGSHATQTAEIMKTFEQVLLTRSEERRVGKECRTRWGT